MSVILPRAERDEKHRDHQVHYKEAVLFDEFICLRVKFAKAYKDDKDAELRANCNKVHNKDGELFKPRHATLGGN